MELELCTLASSVSSHWASAASLGKKKKTPNIELMRLSNLENSKVSQKYPYLEEINTFFLSKIVFDWGGGGLLEIRDLKECIYMQNTRCANTSSL